MILKNHIVTPKRHERCRSNSLPGPGSNSYHLMGFGFLSVFLSVAVDAHHAHGNDAAIAIALNSSKDKIVKDGGGERVGGILPEIHDHGLGLNGNKFADVS